MNTTTTPKTNAITAAELDAIADDLGAQAGKGSDTQVRFMLKIVEGAYFQAVDLIVNKHGTGVDDAEHLAERYWKARSGNAVFDAGAANQRKLCSNLRTCVKLGSWSKGGNGEPLATVNNLMTLRQKLRKDPTTAKRVDDAANILLKYARAQLKRDTLVSDDELRTMCFKPTHDSPDLAAILEGVRKTLTNVKAGKAAKGTVICQAPEITAAISAITKVLTDNAKANGKAQGPVVTPGQQTFSTPQAAHAAKAKVA